MENNHSNHEDRILEMFIDPDRWQAAISKGIDKDIRKDQLYQLTKSEVRGTIYMMIKDGNYRISPPHAAQIPKGNGEFRTVYVNEPIDRIVLSIANDLLFEICPEMVHHRCKSYQKGIGCGKVVQEVSRKVCESPSTTIGWKSDLSKYFDSVPLRYIDGVFDAIERKHGKSALIDMLRDYYHSDIYFDVDGNVSNSFQSLKQGCAVAAFLADAIIYHIDDRISKETKGYYVRYSDDMLYIGDDYEASMGILVKELAEMDMKLNPKKVEYLSKDRWFKFLGFSIKGDMISLSKSRIKSFQKEIESRTIKVKDISFKRALNLVNRYMYLGNGEYSWATQVLSVCNVSKDIETLNSFVMDCLRAVVTKKKKLGGLGYVCDKEDGCIVRGLGRNVKANKGKTPKNIEGYNSIGCMRNAMLTSKALYRTLVAQL